MARPRQIVSRGKRRQLIWSSVIVRAAGLALSSTAKFTGSLGGLGVTSGGGATLVRTRGQGIVHFDADAIADVALLGLGLGIFSSDAFAQGAAALPGPITEVDFPWVWHSVYSLGPVVTATANEESLIQNIPFVLDSKAMRILKPSETMGFVAEVLVTSGGGTVDFSVAARQLFKLG